MYIYNFKKSLIYNKKGHAELQLHSKKIISSRT